MSTHTHDRAPDGGELVDIATLAERHSLIARLIALHRKDNPACRAPAQCVADKVLDALLTSMIAAAIGDNPDEPSAALRHVVYNLTRDAVVNTHLVQLAGDVATVVDEVAHGRYVTEEIYVALRGL